MRTFLPIKGPGGRTLTPREKVALLVLAVTLVVSLLTMLAGPDAFVPATAKNPILAAVAVPSRLVGGGTIAFYALVIVWSALIYWKGERAANLGPLPARLFAAVGAAVGISGALGVADLAAAGGLGSLVGGAVRNTLGPSVGFPILLLLVLLGFSLAAQGYWSALRGPLPAGSGAPPATPRRATSLLRSESFWGGLGRRRSGDAPMPDDGDPTSEDRSLAVTKAMEEIERSTGVTILEVERDAARRSEEEAPEEEAPASSGEEVAAAPPPPAGTEEAEVQRGLESVRSSLLLPPDAPTAATTEPPAMQGEATTSDGDDVTAPPADATAPAPPREDPYERPGLLDGVAPDDSAADSPKRPYTSFDWRGRPLD